MEAPMAAISLCLDCDYCNDTTLFGTSESYVEDEFPNANSPRDGTFCTCPSCGSIDVDVFSPEGWKIENHSFA